MRLSITSVMGLVWFGAIISLMGLIWFLEGIGVVPGRLMKGQFWTMGGAFVLIVGLIMIAMGLVLRRGKRAS